MEATRSERNVGQQFVSETNAAGGQKNTAGGAKKQDRSLVSYIRGAWSMTRDEDSADTQRQHLRKEETPSFLLAVFRNVRRGTAVTLAQILWVANGKDDAHFLVANGEKSIVADLQEKATGRKLLKRLRERGWAVCEAKSYREELCERERAVVHRSSSRCLLESAASAAVLGCRVRGTRLLRRVPGSRYRRDRRQHRNAGRSDGPRRAVAAT